MIVQLWLSLVGCVEAPGLVDTWSGLLRCPGGDRTADLQLHQAGPNTVQGPLSLYFWDQDRVVATYDIELRFNEVPQIVVASPRFRSIRCGDAPCAHIDPAPYEQLTSSFEQATWDAHADRLSFDGPCGGLLLTRVVPPEPKQR